MMEGSQDVLKSPKLSATEELLREVDALDIPSGGNQARKNLLPDIDEYADRVEGRTQASKNKTQNTSNQAESMSSMLSNAFSVFCFRFWLTFSDSDQEPRATEADPRSEPTNGRK
jgi:hypothetical protein